MSGQSETSPTIERLYSALESGRAVVLTGPMGIGKTHALKIVSEELSRAGRYAPIISGSSAGTYIHLGPFARLSGLKLAGIPAPGAIIDAFVRDRMTSAVLADNVEMLDEASLFVVTQLIAVDDLPVVLAARDLNQAPAVLQHLYDSEDLMEIAVEPMADDEARRLIASHLDGEATPRAEAELIAASEGNPLHLREIIRGSIDDGRLVSTKYGWELQGVPGATKRLAQILGARFERLPASALDAATVIALAHEYPLSAMEDEDREVLLRSGIIDIVSDGWARLTHPLDAEHLVGRCPHGLLRTLAQRASDALQGIDGDAHPEARRQSAQLALDHRFPADIGSTIALAEYAMRTADVELAQRAAAAVAVIDPGNAAALRITALVASFLGDMEVAEERFSQARDGAQTDIDRAAVALAHAQHLGTRRHDAGAALAVVTETLADVADEVSIGLLKGARVRWAAMSGTDRDSYAEDPHSHDGAVAIIVSVLAGVVSGPLSAALKSLPRAQRIPADVFAAFPGGQELIDVSETLAELYSGDIESARAMLQERQETAQRTQPELLGLWEYRLGHIELLTSNAEEAYKLGREAVAHLSWRDAAGRLPAAQALVAAAAAATGRSIEAHHAVEAIPPAASGDAKILMFGAWRRAWQAASERKTEQSADFLLDGARWLMEARHTYLAGMLAHDLARQGRRTTEAAELLQEAYEIAGGGLLEFFARHSSAIAAGDLRALERCAADALELGLKATAVDTWLWLAANEPDQTASLRHDVSADRIHVKTPSMALWNAEPKAPTLLTKREHVVIRYAAERYTAKEIAAMNGVSVNTVTNQLASAFRKLGISSREELRELFNNK